MRETIKSLPAGQVNGKTVLTGLLGKIRLDAGLKIVKRQMKRFNHS
jgi:hypothetical protein